MPKPPAMGRQLVTPTSLTPGTAEHTIRSVTNDLTRPALSSESGRRSSTCAMLITLCIAKPGSTACSLRNVRISNAAPMTSTSVRAISPMTSTGAKLAAAKTDAGAAGVFIERGGEIRSRCADGRDKAEKNSGEK